jgi:hypothetical protein
MRMEFQRVAAANIDPRALVSADAQALSDGNAHTLAALFAPDARIFQVPQDPDRLTGEVLARRPFARVVVLETVVAGDLVAAKLRVTDAPGLPPTYMLAIYRVREGLIRDLWYIASSKQDDADAAKSARDVIANFGAANNRGDVEAFLALFSPHAKNFRNSGDAHKLGDKPSVSMVDEKSRRAAYLKMFANGAPAQVEKLGTVALNDMIVISEVATLPTGKVIDEMSVYRVENGLIVRDWFIFNQARP